MVNGVKKLITTQDYMDALGVDDETAQISLRYECFYQHDIFK